jgi:hypothetical protein
MYKAAERAFLKMFALKPAGEFGLAVVLCPQKARHLSSSVVLMEKTL